MNTVYARALSSIYWTCGIHSVVGTFHIYVDLAVITAQSYKLFRGLRCNYEGEARSERTCTETCVGTPSERFLISVG